MVLFFSTVCFRVFVERIGSSAVRVVHDVFFTVGRTVYIGKEEPRQ